MGLVLLAHGAVHAVSFPGGNFRGKMTE